MAWEFEDTQYPDRRPRNDVHFSNTAGSKMKQKTFSESSIGRQLGCLRRIWPLHFLLRLGIRRVHGNWSRICRRPEPDQGSAGRIHRICENRPGSSPIWLGGGLCFLFLLPTQSRVDGCLRAGVVSIIFCLIGTLEATQKGNKVHESINILLD